MKKLFLIFLFCLLGSSSQINAQSNNNRLKNSPLVGIWVLERAIHNNSGSTAKIYPGNFKIITPEGNYTIFIHTRDGGIITSEGSVVFESDSVYIEKVKFNLNGTLNGKDVRQRYKIVGNYLYKTFFIEKNNLGGDYNTREAEVWKRVSRPEGYPGQTNTKSL